MPNVYWLALAVFWTFFFLLLVLAWPSREGREIRFVLAWLSQIVATVGWSMLAISKGWVAW